MNRLQPLPWELDSSLAPASPLPGFSAVTSVPRVGRRIMWTVYAVSANEWRIGVGIPSERGLHTVIAAERDETAAKATARDLALIAGHEWR